MSRNPAVFRTNFCFNFYLEHRENQENDKGGIGGLLNMVFKKGK